MAAPDKIAAKVDLLRLWYHENSRVFQDRLVNDEDRTWFTALIKDKMNKDFKVSFDDVVSDSPMIYGDFMVPGVENPIYAEITNYEKVKSEQLIIQYVFVGMIYKNKL